MKHVRSLKDCLRFYEQFSWSVECVTLFLMLVFVELRFDYRVLSIYAYYGYNIECFTPIT